MTKGLTILICENLLKEAETAISKYSDYAGISVVSFPNRCGRPPMKADFLMRYLPPDPGEVIVIGGGCLPPPEERDCIAGRCRFRIFSPCYGMLVDRERANEFYARNDYLMTPTWLANWRARIADWGFTEENFPAFFRDSAIRLNLLDTGVVEGSISALEDFSKRVDLPYTVSSVGLDYFALLLRSIILEYRLEKEGERSKEVSGELQKKSADYAMAVDLLRQFTHIEDEEGTVDRILEIFGMLFAPQALHYVAFDEGKPVRVRSVHGKSSESEAELFSKAEALEGEYAWIGKEDGFLLKASHGGKIFGVLVVDSLAFPEFARHYLNLALSIMPICALSIDNVRNYQQILEAERALKAANLELSRLAAIDGLTGIANRRRFDEYFLEEWRRAQRTRSPLSLIMADIDFFKDYNDTYGHQAGDECLITIAALISRNAARPGDLPARYGGEEFAVILPDTDEAGARILAERMGSVIRESALPHKTSTVKPVVTLSFGLACLVPDPSRKPEELIALADKALYRAKAEGRDRVADGS